MRLSQLGALTACAGLALTGWALFATAQGVARISGGSYGPSPVQDFAIEHFWAWGPALVAIGLIAWAVGRSRPAATPAPPQRDRADAPKAAASARARVQRREFQGVDSFGWTHTLVCEWEEPAPEQREANAPAPGVGNGPSVRPEPPRIFLLGGGGLVRISAGLYLNPATQDRIRSDDPCAP